MRAPTNLVRGTLGFNMTPMIDVVFLLVIFFLVSSHLAQQESQYELDLPNASSGVAPEKDDVRRVVVNVLPEETPAGRIMVGDRRMGHEELKKLIALERKTHGRLEVRIRTHRKVPYRLVEPIMVACARSGVWKVTFAVLQK